MIVIDDALVKWRNLNDETAKAKHWEQTEIPAPVIYLDLSNRFRDN